MHSLRGELPKLYGNCAFPRNFHTKKLGEILGSYGVAFLLSRLISEDADTCFFIHVFSPWIAMIWPQKIQLSYVLSAVEGSA